MNDTERMLIDAYLRDAANESKNEAGIDDANFDMMGPMGMYVNLETHLRLARERVKQLNEKRIHLIHDHF